MHEPTTWKDVKPACPICGSYLSLPVLGAFDYQCRACGTKFLAPSKKEKQSHD